MSQTRVSGSKHSRRCATRIRVANGRFEKKKSLNMGEEDSDAYFTSWAASRLEAGEDRSEVRCMPDGDSRKHIIIRDSTTKNLFLPNSKGKKTKKKKGCRICKWCCGVLRKGVLSSSFSSSSTVSLCNILSCHCSSLYSCRVHILFVGG